MRTRNTLRALFATAAASAVLAMAAPAAALTMTVYNTDGPLPPGQTMIEDFDTLVAKWRGYCRHGMTYIDWRWINGAIVS